ncbi:MAG: toxin-antitoxin system HicB family antitoxin [Planctomycetota bacterium]
MSTLSLRLPESLHEMARQLAEEENVSVNQLITLALAEKISALKTADYFQQRGSRASRAKFEQAMAKVPKVEPAENDRVQSD